MIVSIIIFLVSIVVLGVLCFRMSIIWPTIIKIAGIILIMFSTIMFCVKMSGYNTTLHNEYSLYLLLFQIKIPKSKTVLMTNIGVSLLMISSALILVMLQKKTFLHGLVYVVTVTVFFYVYYPRTAEKIYLVLLKNGYSQSTILHIKDILDSASLLVIVIYIVVPYLVMLHKYRRTLLYERRKEMLASGIVWFLIDLTLLIMLFGGGLYHYMFFELNFSSYPLKVEKLKSGFIMLLPSIIMVCTILFMVRRYEPMGKWTKEKEHRQLLQAKDEGVFVLLHAYKNAFGSIMMYADCENQEYAFLGSEEKRLEIVKRIAQEQFDKLNNAINIFKTNNQRSNMKENMNLIECVEKVVEKNRNEDTIVYKHDGKPIMIYADEYQIAECIACLLSNAIEAVKMNEKFGKKKEVIITVGREDGFAFIEIRDNGYGIKKEDRDKVFTPFYSTKEFSDNYGLGLPYVKNVVNAHNGKIQVRSKLNLYTTIQIMFEEVKR